jgi:hypothetical protein
MESVTRVLTMASILFVSGAGVVSAAPLPPWNDTASKKAIVAFVQKVTKEDSPDFVPQAERIAVFDNDGTLWAEQPAYFQLQFALDRVKAMAPRHPEWKTKEALHLDGLPADDRAARLPARMRLQDVHRLRRRSRGSPGAGRS